jgi:hypothetical protein
MRVYIVICHTFCDLEHEHAYSSLIFYQLESYWTYELCHGRYIRQYHEEREGKKVKLQEYYLGKWNKTQFAKLSKCPSQ